MASFSIEAGSGANQSARFSAADQTQIFPRHFPSVKKRALAICFFLGAIAAPLFSQNSTRATPEERFKLGVGFDYSRGDYGFSTATEVLSVPVYLTAESDDWLVRLTVPYLTVKGPGSVVGDVGAGASGAPRPTTKYESGLGDTMLSLTYHARHAADGLTVDLTGRVKFATADQDRGLGTGETDYYVQTDLYETFGSVTPFVTLGYRFLGSNATFPLKDGAYASAGSSYHVSTGTAIGAGFDWRERLVRGVDDATDIMVFVSHSPNDRWNLLGYVLGGLNKASPDIGVGGIATYRF